MVRQSLLRFLLLLSTLDCLGDVNSGNSSSQLKITEEKVKVKNQNEVKLGKILESNSTKNSSASLPPLIIQTDVPSKPKKGDEPLTLHKLRTWALCNACGLFFDYTATLIRRWKRPLESIQRRLTSVCPMIPMFSPEAPDGPEVCLGLIEHFTPTIYYIVQNSPQLQGNAFCGFVLQQFGCEYSDPHLEWTVNLTESKLTQSPALDLKNKGEIEIVENVLREKRESFVSSTTPSPFDRSNSERRGQSGKEKSLFKILHLSDLHVDLQYKYGAISVCREKVICCRPNSTKVQSDEPFGVPSRSKVDRGGRAGYFADSHACGSPMNLLTSALQHITRVHPDIRMVYMGGDLVPHDIHGTTKEGNIQVTTEVTNLIKKFFPTTPVIPVLGNHDTHPVNFFSPPGVPSSMDTRWIYNVTLKLWKDWVPEGSAGTYMREGYYSREMPGNLKIIALNTNMCYGFNFWGMYQVNDPGDQLAWFIRELDEAEKKGQQVHIVGHVPPGSPDCNKVWSRNFYQIVSRYHRIIKGQFFGHLHKETLKVFYSPTQPNVAINAAFISPAFTPYKSKNPSYKIFYADGSPDDLTGSPSWDIMDYELYVFDLARANKVAEEAIKGVTATEKILASYWVRLYKATTAYDLPDTKPGSLGLLVNRLAQNQSLFDLYYQHYEKALRNQREPLTLETQREVLCDIVRPYAQHDVECDRVTEIMEQTQRKRQNDIFLNFGSFTK